MLLAACSHGPGGPATANVSILPDDPNEPYVISAIDYHFHDAHPTRPIAPGRTLIIRSQSQAGLLHNVTIPGTTYSKDLPPGGQLVIKDVASLLGGPGQYPFFCKYHVDLGMKGVIVIS